MTVEIIFLLILGVFTLMAQQLSIVLVIKDMISRHEECKKKGTFFGIKGEDIMLPVTLFLIGMIFMSLAVFYMMKISPL